MAPPSKRDPGSMDPHYLSCWIRIQVYKLHLNFKEEKTNFYICKNALSDIFSN
jgi:hypothetical protein